MTEEIKQYLDCYVYQVEIDKSTSKKIIHIDGYCYYTDDDNYQMVQGVSCYMDIDGSQSTDKADALFEMVKQYQGPVSLEEIAEYYKDCTPLYYEQVTQETPCGFYVNF
jgi:hypothetical protein